MFDKNRQQILFEKNIQIKENIYLVAEFNNKAVGFISCHVQNLLHHSGPVGEIQEMFVEFEHRSSGIGMKLLNEVKRLAKEKGVLHLEVTSNKKRKAAHTFYLREGFINSHEKFVFQF